VSTKANDIAEMQELTGAQFALYADPDRTVIKAWGVADPDNEIAVPATFIVDVDGKIRYVHVGEDKTDRPVMKDVLDVLRYLSN